MTKREECIKVMMGTPHIDERAASDLLDAFLRVLSTPDADMQEAGIYEMCLETNDLSAGEMVDNTFKAMLGVVSAPIEEEV